MARRLKAPNELPGHYKRDLLPEPVSCKFRLWNDTEGRGNNFVTGKLYGWDSHVTEQPCAIVFAKEGGWRTLSPHLWEIK